VVITPNALVPVIGTLPEIGIMLYMSIMGGLWDFRIVLYDATGVEKNGGSGDTSHISLGPAW
jgi:hypothetical protein